MLNNGFLHVQGVDEAVILAVFGHEIIEQEAWRKSSTLSMGHIIDAINAYQQLELEQVIL